jgi:hypothetical protein
MMDSIGSITMAITIHKSKDNSIKMVLDEPEMLVSLLKNFLTIDILKEIQPSDIEDVTHRFLTLVAEQKDSDTIKRINLKGNNSLFVIAIIEHESRVNFRAPYKMLMYIALILDAYEKELIKKSQEDTEGKNVNPTLLKDFKYPPILPIVFYDGESKWTAETNFLYRTEMHDIFEKYIPKFEYELIDLGKHKIDDLTKFGDLLSLFLILDKVKTPEELSDVLSSLPEDYIDKVKVSVPEHLRRLLSNVMQVLLTKIDVPKEEVDDVTERIYERGVPEMFNIENYSVRETRRLARVEERSTIARRLLARKRPIDEIIEVTELTKKEIEELKKNPTPNN